ncbi:Ig-like domain-containing protein [Leucobacter komagatae]|uniref:Bacterial Ig domain-containing protein n=1 Tax=Leucobacter komagatae TaxID=55969 RepID=A0A0D0IPT2_9MICO|nr:Ig-like domain-containing protein [Leucobacter komagatae]KIP53604.1 hypothetical protein SD72_02880 [Leucobacter komagatae]
MSFTSPAINTNVASENQVFTGTGYPGAKLVLKTIEELVLYEGTVGPDGTWSAKVPKMALGIIRINVVNYVNNKSYTLTPAWFNVVKVYKNSLNTPAKGATTITGTANPYATVIVYAQDGTKISEVRATVDGDWSLKAPTSTGTYYPTYNGTRGDNFTYTAADVAFVVASPAVGSDLSPKSQAFSGTGTPGSTYVLKNAAGTQLHSGTVAANGSWSATLTGLAEGTLKLTVVNTIDGAVKTVDGGQFTVLKDHKNSLNTPAKGATTITGTGIPGETVAILSASGTKVSEAKVAADGSWSLKAPTSTGTYYPTYNGTRGDNFTYTAADAAFVLETPSKGSTLNAKDQVFAGTGEPGSTYELTNASGTVLHRGTVASNGNWYAKVASLPEGSLKLTMLNTIDGKTSSIDGGTFTVRAAYKNSLNTPAKGATTITGTGIPGETVAILSASGTKISEAKVAADGSWSLKAPTSTGTYYPTYNGTRGDNFTYTETDPVLTFEYLTPKVGSDISETDQTFTGRGTPGAVYSLRDSRNVVLARGTVSANGNWSATAGPLPVGGLKLTVLMTLNGATQSYEVGNFTVLKDHKNSLNTPAKGATTITGTGIPGETVAILSASGTNISEAKVAADGSWSLKAPTSTGTYYPTYNGTRGDNFTYTEADPVLTFELLTPKAGSTLSELNQTFTGTGTPGAEYTLRDGRNVILASGKIPASGTWSVTADDLPVGALSLTAQMTLRGETHTVSLGSFTVAKDYPNSLNTPAKGDEAITGTGTPGEVVSLHAADGSKVSESTVEPDGSWSLTAPTESGSYYPSYGGERGEDFGYEVADPAYEFALLTPSAGSEISTENQEFTGTATPGSTVVLKDGNGNVLYEGEADEAGNWSGTVPKLPEGPLHLTVDNTVEGVTTSISGGEFLAVAEGNGEDTPVLDPAIAGGYGLLLAAGAALGLRRNRKSEG